MLASLGAAISGTEEAEAVNTYLLPKKTGDVVDVARQKRVKISDLSVGDIIEIEKSGGKIVKTKVQITAITETELGVTP